VIKLSDEGTGMCTNDFAQFATRFCIPQKSSTEQENLCELKTTDLTRTVLKSLFLKVMREQGFVLRNLKISGTFKNQRFL
jgi:hypothetical protein